MAKHNGTGTLSTFVNLVGVLVRVKPTDLAGEHDAWGRNANFTICNEIVWLANLTCNAVVLWLSIVLHSDYVSSLWVIVSVLFIFTQNRDSTGTFTMHGVARRSIGHHWVCILLCHFK